MAWRFYLSLKGSGASPTARREPLLRLFDRVDLACVALDLADTPPGERQHLIEALAPTVQDRGCALVLAGAPADRLAALIAATGADGLCIAIPASADRSPIPAARRHVGRDSMVLGAAGLSRHAAMLAAEDGADAVVLGSPGALDETLELVGWWADVMAVPCVATGLNDGAAVRDAIAAGADFIDLGDVEWWTAAAVNDLASP
ncbi:MAG: thiamine phosphate synthase [Rhodospirillaceae bacterium]|nr:thiamine phosphate synthase [Rhodospirillaceae bacterium]